MLYALEEAIKTMEPGVTQWVWALDMSGFGLKHASPMLPLHMNALFSRHYPELLGTALIINAPRVFSGLWSWIKRYVDPNTVSKVRFLNGSRADLRPVLREMFPDDLASWLEDEIMANRKSKLAPSQKQYWKEPPAGCGGAQLPDGGGPEEPEEGMPVGDHDPRASPYMIHTYFDPQGPRNVSRTPDTAMTQPSPELTVYLLAEPPSPPDDPRGDLARAVREAPNAADRNHAPRLDEASITRRIHVTKPKP